MIFKKTASIGIFCVDAGGLARCADRGGKKETRARDFKAMKFIKNIETR